MGRGSLPGTLGGWRDYAFVEEAVISESHRKRDIFWAALVFALALALRLPGLSLFLTSDERTNTYLGTAQVLEGLLRGDFGDTYWHFYPGVTMSWLGMAGLLAQYLVGGAGLSLAAFLRQDISHLIAAARAPFAVLTAGSVAGVYLLARPLFGQRTALVGAILLAVDPFYLAHSRVIHVDAPTAAFMALSALSFALFWQERLAGGPGDLRWAAFSGGMAGLAMLTRSPAPYLFAFIPLAALVGGVIERPRRPVRWLSALALFGAVAAVVFFALWPAMWVDPAGTLRRMLAETYGKVEAGHVTYFLGRVSDDPGPLFYPYVVAFRLTPLTSLGALLGLALAIFTSRSKARAATWYAWAYVFLLFLLALTSPKKQDRYLLAVFPFIDLLAAGGLVGLLELMGLRITDYGLRIAYYLLAAGALLLGLTFTLPHYPYFFTYYNALMGGLPAAVDKVPVGWGEGMERVGAYLNGLPEAHKLRVAAVPAQCLRPYFSGQVEQFHTAYPALAADYVVLYMNQVQRLAPAPEIVRYFQAQEPEQVVLIGGVPYAWVYKGPRFVTPSLPAPQVEAHLRFGAGMRLRGYGWRAGETPSGPLRVTLYWQAISAMGEDYAVSLRLLDGDGQILSQRDGWPGGGLLPTHLWRAGDFVRDEYEMELPEGTPPGSYQLEIGVYRIADEQLIAVHRGTGQPAAERAVAGPLVLGK
jgi:4-amino-4-deoxy-L-arabinose transferase-like glycosyltransferase